MKLAWLLGIGCAILLHLLVLLFGGLIFASDKKPDAHLQAVELLSPDEPKKEEEQPQEQKPDPDELEQPDEKPPDATEILRDLEPPVSNEPPVLDAASLGAIEAALNGEGGAGDFSDALSFHSGGRLDGRGHGNGALEEKMEDAFSMAEIDQKPRAVFQAQPLFPGEMRGKKIEGVVTLIFVVDASGKVANPRVEKSSHPAFEKPALDAVRQWKFEPAVKGGQRVGCKMRVTLRFQPS
ncbi:MAG: energy transducer TonB [Planctomycetes bacterium]|nr:energy transducer TonB [Planctomycetota bacterium]